MQTGVKTAKLMEEQVGIKAPSTVEKERTAAIQAALKKHRDGKGIDDSHGPSIYDEHKVPGYYNPDESNSTGTAETVDQKLKKYVGHLDMLKARGLSVQEDAVVMGKIVGALQVAVLPESEVPDDDVIVFLEARCAFSDRNVHSRMPFGSHACSLEANMRVDQWHSSRLSTPHTGWHCKLHPNTERN
jgi:hypothetical protein